MYEHTLSEMVVYHSAYNGTVVDPIEFRKE